MRSGLKELIEPGENPTYPVFVARDCIYGLARSRETVLESTGGP